MAVSTKDGQTGPGADAEARLLAKKHRTIEKAREHLIKAEKRTRPSLAHWKPKLTSAGEEYCRAALLFYQAGEVEASKINLLSACDCFKKKRAWYSAAKTLEQAVAITCKQGDTSSMSELSWRSAALFRKAGQPDSAAQLLERTSHSLAKSNPETSILMLESAVETVETENRPIQAASYTSQLLRIALVRKNNKDAILHARKLVELYQEAGHKPSTGRSVLGLVLLLLNGYRVAEAELVAREFGSNCSLEQNVLIEDLLDAYDQNDCQKIVAALKSKCLSGLESEYKSVLECLRLPPDAEKVGIRPRTRSRRNFFKKEEEQEEEKEGDSSSSSSSSSSSNEEGSADEDGKKKGKEEKSKKKKKAKKAVKMEESRIPAMRAEGMSEDPPPSSSRLPQVSLKAGSDNAPAKSRGHGHKQRRQKKSQSRGRGLGASAYIDVATDSIDRHRPDNLPDPAVYMDVEGVDHLQPAYMGMTVEQWREYKRALNQDEADYGLAGTFGDDDGF